MSVSDYDPGIGNLPRAFQIGYWTERAELLETALANFPPGSKQQYPLRQARVELARLKALPDG